VTPNVEELFQTADERRSAKMSDIWDELERPATATYNTRRLQDLLEQIKKDHAFLGVKTQRVNLPKPIAEQLGRDSGLLLIAVEQDSPAEQGGLFLGDLLVELDGQPLRHQDDLMETLNDKRIDQAVPIRYVRTGQLFNSEIKLIKRESGKSAL
jgi:S1-C subfamily serine protease